MVFHTFKNALSLLTLNKLLDLVDLNINQILVPLDQVIC